jgi:hypothetical protein
VTADTADVFDAAAAEFATRAHQAAGKFDGDPGEARLLLELMRDDLGLAAPGDLGPGDLRSLLGSYSRQFTARDRDDAAEVIAAARGLLEFLAETGRIAGVSRLKSELDEIEPGFLDAAGEFEDGEFEDGAALREAFGLPERLPAIRLPDPPELATAARHSTLLGRARALAIWAGGKELTDDGMLARPDLLAAARLLDIPVPEGADSIADVAELAQLWHLSCGVFFLDDEGERAAADESLRDWPDGDDDAVLDVWCAALGHLCGYSLEIDDGSGKSGLGLGAVGGGLSIALFVARWAGLPRDECRSLVSELAVAEMSAAAGRRALAAWTRAHGDPTDLLLGRLAGHGAVEVDGEVVRLSRLGMWQLREELAGVVDMPLLVPADEMTAADLVDFGLSAPEDELAAEQQAWLAARPAADAVRELLAVGASGGAAERMTAASLAQAAGPDGEPLWREALGNPVLCPYAKLALNELAGHDPAADPLPGLDLVAADAAWLLGDTVLAMADAADADELAGVLREALPPGSEEQIFEVMWRSANPAARQHSRCSGGSTRTRRSPKLPGRPRTRRRRRRGVTDSGRDRCGRHEGRKILACCQFSVRLAWLGDSRGPRAGGGQAGPTSGQMTGQLGRRRREPAAGRPRRGWSGRARAGGNRRGGRELRQRGLAALPRDHAGPGTAPARVRPRGPAH